MSVDFGATPDGLYEDAARASWNDPGTRIIWRNEQESTYIALMVARPDFRALVDAVWQRATVIRAVPDHLIGDGPCHDCGAVNIRWYADSPLWNRVVGGPDARDDPGGIFCIHCFVKRAATAGYNPAAWRLSLGDQPGPVTDAQYADEFRRIAESEAPILAAELQPIELASAGQANSMIAPNGDRFFPDNPEDAAVFRDGHGAVPEHPDRWPWPENDAAPGHTASLAEWLAYRGLPPNASLRTLIVHERANAELTGVFRGIAAGSHQAAEAIRAQAPATSVIEGGPDLMAWAADLAECRLCRSGLCSAHRPAESEGSDR